MLIVNLVEPLIGKDGKNIIIFQCVFNMALLESHHMIIIMNAQRKCVYLIK